MLTLGLKAGGPPAVQTKAPRSCCLERLCWEGAVLCSALEGSLEFPNRMRLFDRKPSPLHLLGEVKPSRRIISPPECAAQTLLFRVLSVSYCMSSVATYWSSPVIIRVVPAARVAPTTPVI